MSELTTLVTRVRDRATSNAKGVAMREKRLGIWREITWHDYWESIQDAAHALLALGVEPGDRVAIQSENRSEWLVLDLACVAIGGITVGLYPTNPSAEVAYLLSHSGSKLVLSEDQEQVDKAIEVLADCPDLAHIVYVEPRGVRGRYDEERLMGWDALMEMGREHRVANEGMVAQRMAQAQPDDVITLVYTSGTTGPPKGAMLTHANVEFAIDVVYGQGAFFDEPPGPNDLTLSYLPLCHVAERFFTTWFSCAGGTQVNFAESIDTVPQNIREVQPTVVFGVPRIWEKMLAGARIRMQSATRLKRAWSAFWLGRAEKIGATLVRTGGTHTLGSRLTYAVGWVFFFRALKERLGLRHTRYAGSGAAPIAPEVLAFFMGIGVPMHEVYGQTENTAIATANRPGRVRLGTVGEAPVQAEVKLDETTGEILTRHPGVFAGYWRDEEATARAMSKDGFLHTGDVGEWVEGTHLRITDRMKDIIITAGGKNVAPSEIENGLKASPFIKEAIVIGDGRRYLTALIGIELDTVGQWAQQRHLAYTTYRDLAEKPEVRELVAGIVKDVNSRHNPVEQVKDFAMLPKELDHEDGELTATQKVKRAAIDRMFGELVDELYARADK
ncbi:AMP-binding protein [Nocardioides sp. AE5]|uniref:AMP-dependent synthetase/ligase n=1 Tax=Nocardioides sp. AE5 TaxID=2962573 RepID=UPI002881319A|nr:AMP-binding protein [Nocardioides sp. AE5]MDT0203856.1 AMP-binding protein [Nocardioides sp. AE5]